MSRTFQRPDLAVMVAVFLFLAAVAWMLLAISGRTAPDLAEPASAAEPVAQVADLPDPARAAEPAGRATPLVPLPDDGTPILAVEPGAEVALSAKPGGVPVVTIGDTTEFGSQTTLTVLEHKGNWVGVPTEKLPNGELGWLKLSDDAGAYSIDAVDLEIDVDLSSMTAKLLRDGEVKRSWSIGVGAPDTPTPTGRFAVTDSLENTFNPVYGCCILPITATQPNLPSGWTGGNRMAIHGTTAPLGQATSTGCVRSGEEDLRYLMSEVPLGTPVTISN